MRDKDLYATILGTQPPWVVTEVGLDSKLQQVNRADQLQVMTFTAQSAGRAILVTTIASGHGGTPPRG